MKFYDNAKELIRYETPKAIRGQLYPFFENGFRSYQELINDNKAFFDSDFISNIKGRLLSFLVFRQFEKEMLGKKFPFIPEAKTVNNFNYKSLNLLRNNIIINVCRAPDSNSLPNRSKYRLKHCKLNKFNEKNLFYFVDKKNEMNFKKEPYYMFLTYGYDKKDISFVNLLVPDAKMTSILEKIELQSEMFVYKTDEVKKRETEKILTSLKAEALQKLTLIRDELK